MTAVVARVAAPALPAAPSRVSQATAIEQNRATAEVYAAVMVAQQMPRNEQTAIRKMQESTARKALAERAFFRFNRGDKVVAGPTVQLARELARCWGNIQHNVGELRRDDVAHESEMIAWAWDLETNTRSSVTFIVPHVRDTRTGPKQITDVRDVYENNANMGARRLRECIFAVLPGWFTAEAEDRCVDTLKSDGESSGKTLAQRAADAIASFTRFNIVADQLEQKLDRASGDWTDMDLVTLQQVWRALNRGETTRDEEFPPARVTGAAIEAQAIAAAEAAAARAQAEAAAASSAVENQEDQPAGTAAPAPDPGSDEARRRERDEARAAGFLAEKERRRAIRQPRREPAAPSSAPQLDEEADPRDGWPDVATPPADPPGDVMTGGTGLVDDTDGD